MGVNAKADHPKVGADAEVRVAVMSAELLSKTWHNSIRCSLLRCRPEEYGLISYRRWLPQKLAVDWWSMSSLFLSAHSTWKISTETLAEAIHLKIQRMKFPNGKSCGSLTPSVAIFRHVLPRV